MADQVPLLRSLYCRIWLEAEYIQAITAGSATLEACGKHLLDVRDGREPARAFEPTPPAPRKPPAPAAKPAPAARPRTPLPDLLDWGLAILRRGGKGL